MSAKRRALLRQALRVECLEERIPLAYGATSLVSVNSAGSAAGNAQSYLSDQTLSADGRYYVFASDASNIVAGDTNGARDVFVRDLKLGTVALVSRTAANATSNGLSDQPVISADGMYVAFTSTATNLNSSGVASANGNQQVYRWERTTGLIRLVSLNASGSDGGNGHSIAPSISGDGGRIAFETYSEDLLAGVSDSNSTADVYLRDVGAATPATFLVSHASGMPLVTGNGYATAAQVSRDGTRVIYRSSSTDMQSGVTDINGSSDDLIAYDVLGANAGNNKYVSLQTASASTANQASTRTDQSLSADGQWEVFSSDASDLVSGDTNGQRDVFLRNLQTGAISLVSQGANGALLEPANGSSDVAAISADGNFVAFVSYATNLRVTVGPNSSNGVQQVYRWDRVNNLLSLISRNAANSDGGNAVSYQPSLNQTGSRVAYASDATDLQTGVIDNNAASDVYIRDVTAGTTNLVSHAASSLLVTGTGYAHHPHISRDGSRVVYRSTSGDLQAGVTDLNTAEDLVSYNVTGVNAGANQYVNLQTTLPTTGNQASARTSHSLSADGLWEVFSSDAADLVSGDTNGQRDVFVRDVQTGVITLVSQGTSGPANSSSDSAVISADGNFVAFTSYATNLKIPVGPNSVNGNQQVYRWDRVNNRLSLISRNSADSDGGNNASYQPSINQTGSRVAYASDATDLHAEVVDNNASTDVYIHDVTAGTTRLVSHAASSLLITSAGYAYDALISRDGSRVTYRSTSGDLQTGATDVNHAEDLVSYSVLSGDNQYVSLESAAPTTGNQGSSRTEQSLSSDGQWEVFSSDASDLVAGDTNGSTDVFLRNLATGVTTLISKTSSGVSANATSNQAVISADGNFVAFASYATNLNVSGVNATLGYQQIYLWNCVTGTMQLLSVNGLETDGGNNYSYSPSISESGTRIAFESYADDLIAGVTDTNASTDIYLRDLTGPAVTRLVSRTAADATVAGDLYSSTPRISRDGSTVVFLSLATDLTTASDSNATWDLFAYNANSPANPSTAISMNSAGTATADNGVNPSKFSLSNTGQFVAYASGSTDIHGLATSGNLNIFLRNRTASTTELISVNSTGTAEANGSSSSPSISGLGRYVAYESAADNLVSSPVDLNSTYDVYVRDRGAGATPASTKLVSVASTGTASGDGWSASPNISNDGNTIAFESFATDLDAAITTDTNTERDIFVRKWTVASPVTKMLSKQVGTNDTAGNRYSILPEVSDNGGRVVFSSIASNLTTEADVNGSGQDVFSYNGTSVALVTKKGSGLFTGLEGIHPKFDISNDGSVVAFSTRATGMVPDLDGQPYYYSPYQTYVRNVASSTTERISVDNDGLAGDGDSADPSISGDGRYVAFDSIASNLSSLDGNFTTDVFVRDRGFLAIPPSTTLISRNAVGTASGDGWSAYPNISNDGKTIAFESYATDLDAAITTDTNSERDIFVRNWTVESPVTKMLSKQVGTTDTAGDRYSISPEVSDSGGRVVFNSIASNLTTEADVNGSGQDIFAYNGTSVALVSKKGSGLFTGLEGVDPKFDISNDGSVVAFSTRATGMVPDLDGQPYYGYYNYSPYQVYARNVASGTTERVSVDNGGLAGDNDSADPSISGDGRYVAFDSRASNLSSLDGNSTTDVYVRDRGFGAIPPTTTLISRNAAGTASGDGWSAYPNISNDGKTIAFESYATDLDAAITTDANSERDIFVRNWTVASPVTKMLSKQVGTNDTAGNRYSISPEVSDNGGRVVFNSIASNLTTEADVNGSGQDIFAYNGTSVALVSKKGSGLFTGNDGVLPKFDISNDGSVVAFSTRATGMVPDLDGQPYYYYYNYSPYQVYARNITSGTTERVSVDNGGLAGDSDSADPSISGDGRYVAFDSSASNLSSLDGNSTTDVYVRDRGFGAIPPSTTLISRNAVGTASGNGSSAYPDISNDGNTIVFESYATDLDAAITTDANSERDIFVRKWTVASPATKLLSKRNASNTIAASGYSITASVSDTGATVAFASNAPNLTSRSDTNGAEDVFAVQDTGISVGPISLLEGNSGTTNFTFTVQLSEPSASNVTVSFATVDGTATVAGNDYVSASGSLTFAPGQVTKTVTVLVNGDLIAEPNETFTLVLSNPIGATIANAIGTATILNDDSEVSISDASIIEGNAGTTNLAFVVTLSVPSNLAVSVHYATSDLSATLANNDYISTSGTLSFSPGVVTQTILVPVVGDTVPELDELLRVTLSAAVNATLVTPMADGLIRNDDTNISINSISIIEGNSGNTPAVLAVTLSHASALPVTVSYATANGTATTANNDYVAASSSLTFNPGETSKSISVDIVGDEVPEPNETLVVNLSNPTNAGLAISQGVITILNDDTIISVSDITVIEGNAGAANASFVLTLSQPSVAVVTVQVQTANGSATAGSDYIALGLTTVTFNPGEITKTVTVVVNGDTTVEAHETFSLLLSNPTNAQLAVASATGTILNDDTGIVINDISVLESNSGTASAIFTISLTQASALTVSVQAVTLNNTAVAPSDYVAVPATTVSFAPGELSKTFIVTVNGDTAVEAYETFFVDLINPTNAEIVDSRGVGTIQNDDASFSIAGASQFEGNMGNQDMPFVVTLAQPVAIQVSVDYGTSNGTATVPSDYLETGGTLVFAPQTIVGTILVPIIGDVSPESDEIFFVTLSNPSTGVIDVNRATGTILNDDSSASLAINDVTIVEGNAGTTNAVFTVTLSAASGQTVMVSYATANGTATAGSDYTATNGTLTFNPGELTKTISVPVIGDLLNEANETFFVNLSNAVNATLTDNQGLGTITNDDAVPGLVINDVTIVEGNAGTTNAVFTVTLSAASGQTVTVGYATANGTATAGSDYTATNGTLTFNPGELTKTISVPVIGDLLNEANETFFVNLSNAVNATLTDNQGLGTITNDDAVPGLVINDVTIVEGNAGTTNAVFTVTLSAASGQTVTVGYATANGTATAGSDYTATNGTLTFNPGDLTKTISVPVIGDLLNEANETFFVNLSNAVNATLTDTQGLGTITNDDAVPGLVINDVTIVEGNAGTTNAVFTVTLSAASGQTVMVSYATANGSATAGSDYTATNGTLTFNPGELTKTISVAVIGDLLNEANETFFVNLSNAVNATLTDTQGLGTITNDDAVPGLVINDVTIVEGNAGTTNAVFTVTLSAASGQTVTVGYATVNGSATAGSDYTATNGTLTFNPGDLTKTISVPVIGDLLNEANETFFVNLSNAVNATLTDTQGLGTITNDDAVPGLVINDVTIVEGNAGTTNAVFTVTLSAASGQTVTVGYATANGTATAGSDYTATNGTLTFNPGDLTKTISVPVIGDVLDELNESFFVNLSSPSNANLIDAQAVGTIINDEAPKVESIVIGDGTVQRSNVSMVTVNFNSRVTIDNRFGDAVTVQRLAGSYGAAGNVTVSLSTTEVAGKTSLTIRFTGTLTRGAMQALQDGNYVLQLNAERIRLADIPTIKLDGDSDGSGGDNYSYGTQATDKFFAMYGDIDGDRDVDSQDYLIFRAAYEKAPGQAGYNIAFDYDGDNLVKSGDYLLFRSRYNRRLGF